MVAQDELRRRVRAAMALAGITSWEQLEERTPFSRSLLKDLGTDRAEVTEKHLRPIAAALDVPYAWFTVPALGGAVAGAEDASIAERVEALERRAAAAGTLSEQLEELRTRQHEDSTRLAHLEEVVRALAARDRPGQGEGGTPR